MPVNPEEFIKRAIEGGKTREEALRFLQSKGVSMPGAEALPPEIPSAPLIEPSQGQQLGPPVPPSTNGQRLPVLSPRLSDIDDTPFDAEVFRAEAIKQGKSPESIDAFLESEGIINPSSFSEAHRKGALNIPVQFGKNVLTSGGRAVGDIASVVRHPIQTAKGVVGLGAGLVQKVIPGEQGQEKNVDALVQFFGERYGSPEALGRTAFEDPVGFALDIASLVSGVGAAVGGVGKVAKVGKLAQVGKTLTKVGAKADPLLQATRLAGKGVKLAGRGVGRVAGETLGISTGVGFGAIKQAFRNPSKEFRAALRGKSTGENLLAEARDALSTVKEDRAAAYQIQFEKVKGINATLDVNPLKLELNKQLKRFNITVDSEGALDFSRSTISDSTEAKRVGEIVDLINDWGSQADDLTPIGFDLLKRRLDDFYSPSGQARAIVTALRSNVRKTLVDKVPGYAKMTQEYAQTTELIKQIEKGLSLSDKASMDTAIRKLTSVLRQNNEFRQNLLATLQQASSSDLAGQAAGIALSEVAPRGLARLTAGAGVVGGAAAQINPLFLLALPATSPRLVGEMLVALGLSKNAVAQALKFISKSPVPPQVITQGGFQASRPRTSTEQFNRLNRFQQ